MRLLLILLSITLQMQVDSLCNLAYEMEDQGNFQEALRLNQEALELTPADSLQWISDISSNLTSECFYLGDLQQAVHYGLQALQIDEQTGNEDNLSSSLNNLAAIYIQLDQYDDAVTMASRAVQLEEGRGPERQPVLAGRLGILSEALTKAGRYEEAIPYAQRAIAIDRATGNAYKLGIHLSQLGNVYNQQYDYEKAAPLLSEAVPLLRETGNIASLVITLVPYAQSLRGTRRDKEAEQALQECVMWSQRTGQRQTRMTAYRELSSLYHVWNERQVKSAGGSPERDYGVLSHDYFERYTLLKDSLYSEQTQSQIADLQVRYETNKKELEILHQQAIVRRQRVIGSMVTVLALILIVAVILIIRYARAQKHLAEEKNRMVSILSHDLKSPAMAQQRVLRLLANGELSPDEQLLHALAQAQDAQVDLVLNMLDYARLEAGKVTIEPIALSLDTVVQDVFTLLSQQAKEKQIALTTSGASLSIWADRTMVMTIMRNLVSNAIKFSPEGSEVQVQLTDSGFAVVDHGCGFGEPSKEKGTGLGLLICRRFAQLNQASLDIHSERGKGTTIVVMFRQK